MAPAERGQVLTIAAIVLALLVAFAGLAIDVGRQSSERRYLQNAVDAAALAACDALIDGANNGNAEQVARQIANANLTDSTSGVSHNLAASGQQIFDPGHTGDPTYLRSGILITDDGTVRVAILARIPTVLARAIGVGELNVGAQAMCETLGRPEIPLLARRYSRAPGPLGGFVDYLANNATSKQGQVDVNSVVGYDIRTPASRTAPGPDLVLYGPQSKADNDSSFHGFVAFDIRNYLEEDTRVYFNGVPPGANPSTQKASQGRYIVDGYPGPGFPPVVSPPDPNNQVATIGGMSTAETVGNFDKIYNIGDEVMLGVYSGTVMQIADFTIVPPDKIDLPANGTQGGGANFIVTRDPRFNMNVSLSLNGDEYGPGGVDAPSDIVNDTPNYYTAPANNSKKMSMNFDINNFLPATRGTRVQMKNFVTKNIPAGIYTVWIEASAGAPVYRFHRYSVPVRVGGAVRDFSLDQSILTGETSAAGGTVSMPLSVSTTTDGSGWGSTNPVALSIDPASLTAAGLSASQVSFTASSVVPTSGTGTASTLNINTAGLGPGVYTLHLRATGQNGANQPVTHIEEVTFGVGVHPGDKKYVDIAGFALFKVTDIKSNQIRVQAISPVYASADDPALRQAQHARLVPWR